MENTCHIGNSRANLWVKVPAISYFSEVCVKTSKLIHSQIYISKYVFICELHLSSKAYLMCTLCISYWSPEKVPNSSDNEVEPKSMNSDIACWFDRFSPEFQPAPGIWPFFFPSSFFSFLHYSVVKRSQNLLRKINQRYRNCRKSRNQLNKSLRLQIKFYNLSESVNN